MADNASHLLLDKGLNTVAPALLAEPGTLIDCLNYEMVSDVGYRRIDGYERYDGWIGGDLVDYYRVAVTINDAAVVASLTPGQVLTNTATDLVVGVVVNYTGNTSSGTLVYAPANNEAPVLASGTTLGLTTTDSTRMTTSAVAVKGSSTDDADTFVANVRTYSAALRALVQDFQTPVAGMYFFRNNLVVALDCPVLTYDDAVSGSRNSVQEGSIIGYGTTIYRVVHRENSGTTMTLHVEPIDTQANNANVRVYFQDGSTVSSTTSGTGMAVTYTNSDWAYLVSVNNPETSQARGSQNLLRSVRVEFSSGNTGMDAVFFGRYVRMTDSAGANSLLGVCSSIDITGGSTAAGTATGYCEIVFDPVASSSGNGLLHPQGSYELWDELLSGQRATVVTVDWSKIAGTNRLRTNKSRYQGITANFYGVEERIEAYLTTGASRAAWVRSYDDPLTNPPRLTGPDGATALSDIDWLDFSWGSIWTADLEDDQPKYVAFHGGALALGFARGSVLRSVVGEPTNYDAVDGAIELATGDGLTGLLEAAGDTLIVFGRRSIRRITGTSEADLNLQAIAIGSGAFDYTAVSVGGNPVYVGPDGISTLQQAQEYGDFLGARTSSAVTNTLVPKLLSDFTDTEPGGVAMALAVRKKNQYRLWLTTGEVYTVTFTTQGPKVMVSNYEQVPFAWTSNVADSGKERVFVVWDDVLAAANVLVDGTAMTTPQNDRIYELDRGWGFDGSTFEFYFDLAHLFPSQGLAHTQVDKVRMYGMGHGMATLALNAAGVEEDFEQDYTTNTQDISMPASTGNFFSVMRPVTSIIDHQNWGLGIKLRVGNSTAAGLTTTEPPHICQVMIAYVNQVGSLDN